MRAKWVVAVGLVVAANTGAVAQGQLGETYDYVASIFLKDDGYVRITVWTVGTGEGFRAPQLQGCTSGFGELKFPITDERTKALLSLAQTSMITRSKVYVVTRGCTAPRVGQGAQLVSVVGLAACRVDAPAQCP
jgi:hypothetical protein